MLERLTAGVIAGAAGTLALDLATYTDMLVRGRPSSGVPATVAGRLSEAGGVSLGDDGQADHRRSALGAMLGYATGIGLGLTYGCLGETVRPSPLSAVLMGSLAMAASDGPAIAVGATDPTGWSPTAWAADVVPHLVYGAVTVCVFHWLSAGSRRGRLA